MPLLREPFENPDWTVVILLWIVVRFPLRSLIPVYAVPIMLLLTLGFPRMLLNKEVTVPEDGVGVVYWMFADWLTEGFATA